MRGILGTAILCFPVLSVAQGLVGGVALDSTSGRPLPCVDVALVDTMGRVVAEARTASDGVFQFEAPARGVYRLRFAIDGFAPVWSQPETLLAEREHLQGYRVTFSLRRLDRESLRPPEDTAANAPAWPIVQPRVFPRYPPSLRERGVTGELLVRFVVDTAGLVVPGTAEIVRTTAPEFSAAVLAFLPRARYQPARRGGTPACALVQQPFAFDIAR